jgi:hypothetical protein
MAKHKLTDSKPEKIIVCECCKNVVEGAMPSTKFCKRCRSCRAKLLDEIHQLRSKVRWLRLSKN